MHFYLRIGGHATPPWGWKKRNRLALVTTVTELKAMAAAAINGKSNKPVNGYNRPVATGTPRTL